VLEKREFEKNDFLARLFTAITVVSGLFSIVVFMLLLINYLQIERADPVDNLMLTKMRQEYAALPEKDEALAQRIRDLDLITRKAYFTTQTHLRTGAILLFIGVSVFMVSAKYSIRWRRTAPSTEGLPTADQEFLAFAESRQLIMWAGIGLLGAGLGTTVMTQSIVANGGMPVAVASEAPADAAPAAPAPTWEAMEKNWPSFRGPGSGGTAFFKTAPTDWDLEANKGIRWKVAIPLPGANSPVIWDNKLFVSGADEKTREIYCFDVNDGKELWKQAIAGIAPEPATPLKVNEETGFAAPSLVVHGAQVFAIFANGDLVSLDMDGKQIWAINVGIPENHYGHSSSLLAYDKFLYVQLDQKKAPKLMALDIATGKQVWMAARKTISWASPILAQTAFGPQLILNSETTVDAYDPITGKLQWSQECLGGEVAPSPAYSNGVVFAANEYATGTAIQIEKTDTGSAPKVLWEFDELLPEVSSPVGDGERFYFGTAAGVLVCLDAKTGTKLWEQEFTDGFYSSPVLVGDRIYIADREGQMFIVKASSTYELIAQRSLGESTFATPAFMDGRIYLRTSGHLYCIEQANA